MRDSLRALSNEIVARDQNSVVSPISFMRDYSCLQPPLCPLTVHTHCLPLFLSNSKRVDSHTQNAIQLSLEAMIWHLVVKHIDAKGDRKNRLNQQIFVWTQFETILTPSLRFGPTSFLRCVCPQIMSYNLSWAPRGFRTRESQVKYTGRGSQVIHGFHIMS